MVMDIAVMIMLAVVGAGIGSFACCQTWRIRKNDKSPRSHCMNCKYQLKWYDNIPVISWLILGGKCRKCHKKIGAMELLSELGVAAVFALSFLLWPWRGELVQGNVFEIIKYVVFLVQLSVFAILFIHDAKWKELPVKLMIVSAAIGVVYFGANIVKIIAAGNFNFDLIVSFVGAIIILPGFYYFMYKASKEAWVGGGDPILCLPLAIMLGDFWLSMFCLFGANMIGSIIMLPVVTIKKEKHAMIPFGPFLILGFLSVFFLQDAIIRFISF
jgi:prepilin signal peptidase PulO-like enzyme (type II secretory pathway)